MTYDAVMKTCQCPRCPPYESEGGQCSANSAALRCPWSL